MFGNWMLVLYKWCVYDKDNHLLKSCLMAYYIVDNVFSYKPFSNFDYPYRTVGNKLQCKTK